MTIITTAIVVAAGSGTRMKNPVRKPFIEICGRPLISYCLDVLENSAEIDSVVVVLDESDIPGFNEKITERYGYIKIIKLTAGGKTRQESVYNGLMQCPYCDIVLIHDAARPFINSEIISRAVSDAHDFGASVTAMPVVSTIKTADENGFVEHTLNREKLLDIQTPQTFRAKLFIEAAEYARKNGIQCTDDASLMEQFGLKVKITEGHENNIKVTTSKDLFVAEKLISEK